MPYAAVDYCFFFPAMALCATHCRLAVEISRAHTARYYAPLRLLLIWFIAMPFVSSTYIFAACSHIHITLYYYFASSLRRWYTLISDTMLYVAAESFMLIALLIIRYYIYCCFAFSPYLMPAALCRPRWCCFFIFEPEPATMILAISVFDSSMPSMSSAPLFICATFALIIMLRARARSRHFEDTRLMLFAMLFPLIYSSCCAIRKRCLTAFLFTFCTMPYTPAHMRYASIWWSRDICAQPDMLCWFAITMPMSLFHYARHVCCFICSLYIAIAIYVIPSAVLCLLTPYDMSYSPAFLAGYTPCYMPPMMPPCLTPSRYRHHAHAFLCCSSDLFCFRYVFFLTIRLLFRHAFACLMSAMLLFHCLCCLPAIYLPACLCRRAYDAGTALSFYLPYIRAVCLRFSFMRCLTRPAAGHYWLCHFSVATMLPPCYDVSCLCFAFIAYAMLFHYSAIYWYYASPCAMFTCLLLVCHYFRLRYAIIMPLRWFATLSITPLLPTRYISLVLIRCYYVHARLMIYDIYFTLSFFHIFVFHTLMSICSLFHADTPLLCFFIIARWYSLRHLYAVSPPLCPLCLCSLLCCCCLPAACSAPRLLPIRLRRAAATFCCPPLFDISACCRISRMLIFAWYAYAAYAYTLYVFPLMSPRRS